jgi:hypothetical protein
VKHTSSGDAWVLMMYSGLRESGELWCTWYRNPWFVPHKKRTQHGQLRSIAVSCGQLKTPIVLRQFAKVQVEELGAHRWLVYCQGEGRGFESRRPLQRKSRSEDRLARLTVSGRSDRSFRNLGGLRKVDLISFRYYKNYGRSNSTGSRARDRLERCPRSSVDSRCAG